MNRLANGTLLQGGKYIIEQTIGQGGFGITYLAEQTSLGRKVAVKEFFMEDDCERDERTNTITIPSQSKVSLVMRFRKKFLKEARNIAHMNHQNIVHIIDVFEENNTAYYVMEYLGGGSLSAKVKSTGAIPEATATRYILQIASALEYIHSQKINHLDVKPANIMLSHDDNAILIDFGISKQYDDDNGQQTSTTPVGISAGYAPTEQYMQGGVSKFSPQTDIYSLGATFYYILTGVVPPNASIVNEEGLPLQPLKDKGISQTAIDVILKAMEPRKKMRMQSATEFIGLLSQQRNIPPKKPTPDRDYSPMKRIVGGIVAVALIGVCGGLGYEYYHNVISTYDNRSDTTVVVAQEIDTLGTAVEVSKPEEEVAIPEPVVVDEPVAVVEPENKAEKIAFLEDFYRRTFVAEDGYFNSESQNIAIMSTTMKQKLREEYGYDCEDGNCYAWWIFRDLSQDTSENTRVTITHEEGDWFNVHYEGGETANIKVRVEGNSPNMKITGIKNPDLEVYVQ